MHDDDDCLIEVRDKLLMAVCDVVVVVMKYFW